MESKFELSVVGTISEAQRLWNLLSPHLTIYDEWDFRQCFLKQHPSWTPHFIVASQQGEPVALLPLQKDSASGLIEAFGGFFMEDNRVFLKPGAEEAVPLLFGQIQSKALLRAFIADQHPFILALPQDYPKYSYSLEGVKDLTEFLVRTFPSNRRYSRRKIIKDIEQLNLKIELNRVEDLETLARFNVDTFQDESIFRTDPLVTATFKDLCGLPYPHFVHSFVVDGKTQAVSFSMIYKKTYLFILTGTNKNEVSNLGNYLILHNIKTAIENGCHVFDAGRHDCNWKEQWHLDKSEEYRFTRD